MITLINFFLKTKFSSFSFFSLESDCDYCSEKIKGCISCVKGKKKCRFCSDGLFLVPQNNEGEGTCEACNGSTLFVSQGSTYKEILTLVI